MLGCMLLLAYSSWSQSLKTTVTIHGSITDAITSVPLAGTSIYLHEPKKGIAANRTGNFELKVLPGTYLIEITHAGYKSVAEHIQISSTNNTFNFALQPAVIEAEAVTVTGVGSASSVRRTPVPVDIIRKEDLLSRPGTNLFEALSRNPGVSTVTTGPAVSKPFIRGLGYNRLVVISDGVRQEGQQWGDEHGVEIDGQNVTRTEILKGPASLMYGSDALAGVINIISVNPAPEATVQGNITGGFFTNNREWSGHADLNGNNKGTIWGISSSAKAGGDYSNKYDGAVLNSRYKETDFAGYAGINRNWGFSRLSASFFNQKPGLVEGERDSATGRFLQLVNNNGNEEEIIAAASHSVTPLIPYQHIRHMKLVSDNSLRIGKDRITAVFGFQRNERMEYGNVLQPEERELYFDLYSINYNLQYHFAEKNNWRSTIGLNGMQQQNFNKGQEALIPEYDLFDAGAFVYTQKTIRKVTVSGGARFDNRKLNSDALDENGAVKFTAFSRNFSNLSGSLGLSYLAGKNLTLKANIAHGFRAPSIPELASNGAHEGTNRYEYGSVQLRSEQSNQADAGIALSTAHLSLNAAVFYNAISNYIYYRRLTAMDGTDSLITDGTDVFQAFRYNQSNAKLLGAEANLDIHPHPLDWLHLENSFSFVRGRLGSPVDGSRNLPLIPATRIINQVKVQLLQQNKRFKNVYAFAELDNNFAQKQPFTGYNTETETAGYSLLNAGLGATFIRKGVPALSIYIAGNNLTGKAYQSHLSRLKYTAENNVTGRTGVFNMGRNISLKVNVPLQF